MFHIKHTINNKTLDEFSKKEHTGFIITNKRGNYLSLGDENISHTQGLFFFDHNDWSLYKTIESISLDRKMTGLTNNFYNMERIYEGDAKETFNLFNNSLIYSVDNYDGEILLTLDFRHMFDFDDKGRVYSISKEDDLIVIRYDKHRDNDLSGIDKTMFLVIKGADDYSLVGDWSKRNYSYDARRGSTSEFYVYDALKIRCNNNISISFSFSDDKETAKSHARKVYYNKNYFTQSLKSYVNHSFTSKYLALNTAMKALDDLLITVNNEDRRVGIFAGLPWFNQFWSRDEMVSLKALIIQEKYYLVKSIIFKYLENIAPDGLIPDRLPGSKVDSIDAVGWLFHRIKEYLEALAANKTLNDYLSVSELIRIKNSLEFSIKGISKNHFKDDLIFNNVQETWMDTLPAKRDGSCIEIQALFLSMINLHNYIAKFTGTKQLFKDFEKNYKELVKKTFFKKDILLDTAKGNNPPQVRPNIFLAYYIYPGLLSKNEWRTVFDNALKELWLGWGGLSSVGHTSHLFKPEYTGENDLSYHNGDSWYFMNNMAAIAMNRLDKKYYEKKIDRIILASREDLLFSGFIGCASEISSAKYRKSEGCLSQAWSAATFIELWKELHGA